MKDSFGFIERADVVKEIFFHYSEYQAGNVGDLQLGDDVEFNVAERNVSGEMTTMTTTTTTTMTRRTRAQFRPLSWV